METFRMEEGTVFYRTLERTYELLDFYLSADDDPFPRDAFEFWNEYYAADPSWYDLPEEWRDIAGTAANKQKVMFAVETVQSLLGRLMLAKACEDYEFPNVAASSFITDNTRDFRGTVPPVAHIEALDGLMNRMRQELVESVFEQDLYYWWTAPAESAAERSAKELVERESPGPVAAFGDAIAQFTLSVARFDFSQVTGDPLGDLYQEYFDPKTRRALGEFYTPPSLVDYIVDSASYQPDAGIRKRRLIDPACGSGTFLVEALERYLETVPDDAHWPSELRKLCERSRVVGIDIHPFAVVLAQVRFMLKILPRYRDAVEQDPTFVLKRLPVYRTDSLVDETEVEAGVQQTLSASYSAETIQFRMKLPIRDGEEFEEMPFELPQFGAVRSATGGVIERRQQYFTGLLAVLDAVKEYAARSTYTITEDALEEHFRTYFQASEHAAVVAAAYHDTAEGFLDTVRELREEYNDGRLLKLVEDVVLGSILKNDIDYHYVVGNPPWVSKHSRYEDDARDRRMKQQYLSAWRETDTYLQFTERGLDMLTTGGRLSFIVSNRFCYNMSGEELRGLLAKNRIEELVDFTDVLLFEDATNYSAIVSVEKTVENDDWSSFVTDDGFDDSYGITAARVRAMTDDVPALVETLRERTNTDAVDFFEIDADRLRERVLLRDGSVVREEISTTHTVDGGSRSTSAKLPVVDTWPITTPDEFEIMDRIENRMDRRLGDRRIVREFEAENSETVLGDDIRVGIQTSGDGVYVVHPNARLSPEDLSGLNRISIEPDGISEEFTVETGLLKVDITGEDAARWRPDWDGRLVFVPYVQGDDRARLIRPTELAAEYPRTWDYFSEPAILEQLSEESTERTRLHAELASELNIIEGPSTKSEFKNFELETEHYREISDAIRQKPTRIETLDEDLWWYRYMYRKNIEALPVPKVLTGNQGQYNKLSFDEEGLMAPHNARVYAMMLEAADRTTVAAVLNSAVTEFYHKQIARIHSGKAYSYIKDYTSKWPVVLPEADTADALSERVEEILGLLDLRTRVEEFPAPYVAEAREEGVEFTTVEYVPDTSFRADPTIQSGLDGAPTVGLDGGDLGADAVADETLARYASRSLADRELSRGETYEIPVPLSSGAAERMLERHASDRDRLAEGDIDELEREIDELVFDCYELDEADRECIRRYNGQYETIRPIDPES